MPVVVIVALLILFAIIVALYFLGLPGRRRRR